MTPDQSMEVKKSEPKAKKVKKVKKVKVQRKTEKALARVEKKPSRFWCITKLVGSGVGMVAGVAALFICAPVLTAIGVAAASAIAPKSTKALLAAKGV